MLQTIERYMKQAIVERNSAVSSAALASSLHLTRVANDVVKRWVNEAQEAVNSDKSVWCNSILWLLDSNQGFFVEYHKEKIINIYKTNWEPNTYLLLGSTHLP